MSYGIVDFVQTWDFYNISREYNFLIFVSIVTRHFRTKTNMASLGAIFMLLWAEEFVFGDDLIFAAQLVSYGLPNSYFKSYGASK